LQEQIEAVNKEESGEKLRHSFAGTARPRHRTTHRAAGVRLEDRHRHRQPRSPHAKFSSAPCPPSITSAKRDDSEEGTETSSRPCANKNRPDGTPVYTTLVAVTLMVFYVFAMQCVSTIAVVRRETASWKWPFFQWLYMGALAWVLAFITYHGGKLLGWG
jgi:hypothetical protein